MAEQPAGALAGQIDRKAERQKRIAEAKAEKLRLQDEKKKATEARFVKKDEALKKEREKMAEKSKEVIQRLEAGYTKSADYNAEKILAWSKLRDERRQKFDSVLDRNQETFLLEQEELVRAYQEKEERTEQRLEKRWAENRGKAAAKEGRYTEKLKILSEKMEQLQTEREDQFRQTAEKVVNAKKEVETRNLDRSQAIKESNEKRSQKKTENLQKNRRHAWETKKAIMEKIASKSGESPRAKFLAEETERRAKQRETMEKLVAENKQREDEKIEREREEMLDRIRQNNTKVEHMKEERDHAMIQRTLRMKEMMVERSRMNEQRMTSPRRSKPAEEVAA